MTHTHTCVRAHTCTKGFSKMNSKCVSWEAICPRKDEKRKFTFNISGCIPVCGYVHLCLWEKTETSLTHLLYYEPIGIWVFKGGKVN